MFSLLRRLPSALALTVAICGCGGDNRSRAGSLIGIRLSAIERGTLFIASEKLTDAELAEILADPRVPPLTELSLHNNALSAASVRMIAASPKSQALGVLHLGHNPIGDEGVALLAASPAVQSLRLLSLGRVGMTGKGLHALASSPQAARIALFELRFQNLGADAAVLAETPRDELLLQQTGIDGPTAVLLLRTARVKTLELKENPIRSLGGLDAISTPLVSIDLSMCELTDISILTEARAPSLQEMELDYNPLGDRGLHALAQARWLRQIRFLSVMGAKASREARQALRVAWGERPGLTLEEN